MTGQRHEDAYAALLGVTVEASGGGQAVATLSVDSSHLNPHGTAHGALLFSLAGIALAAAANDDEHSGVVGSLHVDFLRPAHRGDDLIARAEVAERLPKEDLFVIRVTRAEEVIARVTARATRRSRKN